METAAVDEVQQVSSPSFAKGKRTKRHRPHSPSEEVETANCLLLLSQGCYGGDNAPKTTAAPHGLYTCKTCYRTFSSFQALGGHRTSHRKMKSERKSSIAPTFSDDEDFSSPNSLSLQLSTIPIAAAAAPPRMHECSYCGAEFTSGQALGGHMRKHRPGPIPRSSTIPIEELQLDRSKRHKYGFPLDLNLPAPEDDNHKDKEEAKTELGLPTAAPPPPLTPLLIHKV